MLTRRRFALPLQALSPVALDDSGAAVLMLLNPTGGVLGGDMLDTRVCLGPGAHVCLTTPAATRVYRSAGAPAVARFQASLGAGARLEYLPDHVIPSPGARLRQSTAVTLGEASALIVADAWAVGRIARGERWCFAELDLDLTVRDERGLLLTERAVLGGEARDGLGAAEGFPYVATLAAIAPSRDDWASLSERLHGVAARLPDGARVGAGALARGGVLARVLCASAPVLETAVRALWAACRQHLFGFDAPNLRKL